MISVWVIHYLTIFRHIFTYIFQIAKYITIVIQKLPKTYNKEILRKTLTSYYWKSFFIIFYYKWMSSGIFLYAVTKSATNQLFQFHRRFFSKCSTCWCKCYNQFIILFHNSKRPYFTVKRLVLVR